MLSVPFPDEMFQGELPQSAAGYKLPGFFWDTKNPEKAFQQMAQGIAPKSHGNIEESNGLIQYTYLAPPWTDESEKYIAPGMLAFSVKEHDLRWQNDSSVTIMTLPKLNQILHDAHNDFQNSQLQNSPMFYPDAVAFKRFMDEMGEDLLEDYQYALNHNMKASVDALKGKHASLVTYHRLAQQDMFCWLTKFGIMRKINYLGSIINTNIGSTTQNAGTNHTVINIAFARRAEVANVFGSSMEITAGTKVWLVLKRRPGNGAFQVIPGGLRITDRPSEMMCAYKDAAGKTCYGHVWRVGSVLTPGKRDPSLVLLQSAANIGEAASERQAFNDTAACPTLWIALGMKH